jgi:hypothetical protein
VENGGGGGIIITPIAIWRGTPDDLIGLNVRHNDGTDEPAPSGMPYYVPMTFENSTNGSMLMGAAHRFVLAVDTKGKSVAPLDDPQWQPGKSPCEGFAFRDGGLRQSGAVDLCQVFVLRPGAKLDHLSTVKSGGEQFAWAVPRDIATVRPDR